MFALIAKDHEWLLRGALAAALTYSGSAAIHACVLVWRGPIYGDNDVQALVAILSTSCIIIVPLLNWSSTLRSIGARPIILYWGVLVTVGFVCMFIPIWTYLSADWIFFDYTYRIRYEPTIWWPDDLDLMGIEYPVNATALLGCAAPHRFDDGSTNTSESYLGEYTITPQFVIDYRCENPCANFHGMSLFRTDSEIQLLTYDQGLNAIGEVPPGSKQREQKFIYGYETYGLIMLPYILVQGIWAAFFGRRSPSQVRDNFYIFLKGLTLRAPAAKKSRTQLREYQLPEKGRWHAGSRQKLIAKYWALAIYAWAILITLICPPLFVINVVANELSLSNYIESEPPTQVGQWTPWASTGLVLFAALIGRYNDSFVQTVKSVSKYTLWRLKGRPDSSSNERSPWAQIETGTPSTHGDSRSETQSQHSDSYSKVARMFEEVAIEASTRRWELVSGPIRRFRHWLQAEWNNVYDFWINPDLVVRQWLRHPLDPTSGASALIAQLHSNSFPLDVRGLEIERRPTLARHTEDSTDQTDAVISLGAIQPITKFTLRAQDLPEETGSCRQRSGVGDDGAALSKKTTHDDGRNIRSKKSPPASVRVSTEEQSRWAQDDRV